MLTSFFTSIPSEILKRIESIDLNIESPDCNREVQHLLNQTVLFGGKRLRPLLTYLIGQFWGVDYLRLDVLAKSIEMVHAASLAHDDVVDMAKTRRGRPSINALSDNKMAVLAGDYLLAEVIVMLCKLGKVEIVSEMSHVISDLAEGEWIQHDLIQTRQYTRENIEKIALKKTSSVMSFCTASPLFLAENISSAQFSQLHRLSVELGQKIGVAFQLMDDVIDFRADSKKDLNLDIENGVINAVIFEWFKLNPEKFEQYQKGADLKDLFDHNKFQEAVAIVEVKANENLESAKKILNQLAAMNPHFTGADLDKKVKPILFIIDYLASRSY